MLSTNVNPGKWRWDASYPIRILYDDGDYSIIWGLYEGKPAMGARWNGQSNTDRGYPGQGAYPLWHVEPDFVAKDILAKLQKMLATGNADVNGKHLAFAIEELKKKP